MSVRDVAERAGVSPGTVSNAFNHPDRVGADARRRVHAAALELGFIRNEAARSLRTGSSRTLALLLLDTFNPFFSDIARGVEDAAAERGWALLHSYSARRPEREQLYLNLFAERGVAGVIALPTGTRGPWADLRAQGISTVVLDVMDPTPGGMSVAVDDVRGGRLAAEHLLAQGHRRLVFAGDMASPQVRDRERGFHAEVAAAGAQVERLEVPLSIEGGIEVGQALADRIGSGDCPTALFCASDMTAIGALQVFLRRQVRVPEQLAIVGYDDIEFARQVAVPLTSVRQPAYEMGRVAAEMQIAELTGEPPQQRQVVFQPELFERESTRQA